MKGLSQQGCNHVSLKGLSALWPQISLIGKQGKGKRREQMKNSTLTTFSLLFFHTSPFLPIMEPLSLYAPSLFEAMSAFISVSVIHPSILSI